MKAASLLLLFLCFTGCQKHKPAVKEKASGKTEVVYARVIPVAAKDTTLFITQMAGKDTVVLKKDNGKLYATTYFSGSDCGSFAANTEIRDGTVHLSLNNTRSACEVFKQTYYKVEALVNNPKNYTVVKDAYITFLSPGEHLQHNRKKYYAGNINNDAFQDSVTAVYDQIVRPDSAIWNDCGRGVCDLKLEFKRPVKPLTFEAMDVYVHPVMDVNGDGANEIAVYQWWYECCWVTLNIYSYKGNEWNILATSKAFINWEDNDFKDRVVKEKGNYYLMGQKWNNDFSEVITDKVKIKCR